ncbi:MAG: HK97 gp10 family phage protein [Chloroflexi bacterium]|nr:HK97 gp10 family phage protein [Chloroflexota bacterium]
MIGVTVTVEGMAKARARLDKLQDRQLMTAVRRGFSLGGTRLARGIRAEAPKRTGHLARSVRSRGKRGEWRIGPTAWYRHFVIRGTRRGVRPNAFVDRGVSRHLGAVTADIGQGIIRATR